MKLSKQTVGKFQACNLKLETRSGSASPIDMGIICTERVGMWKWMKFPCERVCRAVRIVGPVTECGSAIHSGGGQRVKQQPKKRMNVPSEKETRKR